MKTVVFDSRLYAIRTWLELSGEDWIKLAHALESAVAACSDDEIARAVDDTLQVLSPLEGERRETRAALLLLSLSALNDSPTEFGRTLERVGKAMQRFSKMGIEEKLLKWASGASQEETPEKEAS